MTAGEISEQPGEADKVTESINTVPSSQLSESTSLLGSNEDKAESKSQTKKTVVRWIIGVAIFSLIGIILALVLTNVLGNRDQNLKDSCVVNYDEFINYFPENVVVLQSIGFSVTYSKAYKLLENLATRDTIVLYQCGTPRPTNTPESAMYIEVPINAAAFDSVEYLTYMEMLGRRQNIKYVESPEETASACIMWQFGQGSILELSATNATLRASQLENVDVLFAGREDFSSKSVSISVSSEPSPLQMAEWLKFFALFFNEEGRADEVYDDIVTTYNCLKNNVAHQFGGEGKPNLAWVSFSNATGYPIWTLSAQDWKNVLTTDAGAIMHSTVRRTYDNITMLHQELVLVDVLIEESGLIQTIDQFIEIYQLTNRTMDFSFLLNDGVYSIDKTQSINGASDWIQSKDADVALLLEDMITAAHPLYLNHDRHFIRSLSLSEDVLPVDAPMCRTYAISEPQDARHSTCYSEVPSGGASRLR